MLSVMVTTPVGGDMGDDDILSGSGGIGCDGGAGVDELVVMVVALVVMGMQVLMTLVVMVVARVWYEVGDDGTVRL